MSSETKPERRKLSFSSLDDAVQEAERLLKNGYGKVGNWSLGQCCGHLAEWLTYPIDGFPRMPLLLRPIFFAMRNTFAPKLMRKTLASGSMRDKLPTIPESVPAADVDDAVQLELFRQAVKRWQEYGGPLHPSPLLGDVNRECWNDGQCLHAAHHLGFLLPN